MSYTQGPLYPCNPATARAESTKLGVDPKGEKLIYTNGRAVIIRDLKHVGLSHAYTQHTQPTTVARFSPSGYYAASADTAGNVRIWDVTQKENSLLLATRPISGKINDLAWDGESKRMIVGGEGKDRFGAAFFVDGGNSCGEITGHSKPITALSVRHQRTFRAVSGSDDNSVVLHTAVPFKYDKMLTHHTRFVRDVAFSPNGDLFASVASDGKIFFCDGKTGEVKTTAGKDGGASFMACSWAGDSKRLVTAGADGVVSIWDAESGKSTQSFAVGSAVQDQQNGVVWANENTIVSVSLSGTLNIFDPRELDKAKWRYLHGPTKAITASALDSSANGSKKTFFAGSFDGTMKRFSIGGADGDEEEGKCEEVEGTGHTARVAALATNGEGKVWSAGWDDKVASIEGKSFGSSSVSTGAQPAAVAATPSAVYVATSSGLLIQPASGQSSTQSGATAAVAAVSTSSGDLVAYGSGKTVILASADGTKLKEEKKFEDNKGEVLALTFSKDGKYLAAGDAAGRIVLIDVAARNTLVSSRWTFHSGRIAALAFSDDGKRLASAGNDETIYIWEPEKIAKNVPIKNAHPGGVSGVSWVKGSTKLVSTGADGCVRTWTLTA